MRPLNRRAFSLIELVIVVIIIAVLAAIAIPRMSRGSAGAADSALSGDMAVWRNALDLYQTEHQGKYPTDNTTIVAQLTTYTDINGGTSATQDATHIYGPYMRSIPPLPVGGSGVSKGSATIGATSGAPAAVVAGGYGWVYDPAGNVYPNTGATMDSTGSKEYVNY